MVVWRVFALRMMGGVIIALYNLMTKNVYLAKDFSFSCVPFFVWPSLAFHVTGSLYKIYFLKIP